MTEEVRLKYGVGALLYCPANNPAIAAKIAEQQIKPPFSAAFCLEDAVGDCAVEAAEDMLMMSLEKLGERAHEGFYMPKLFVRVRDPEHLLHVNEKLGSLREMLTGYILPKYGSENCTDYNRAALAVNRTSQRLLYIMPILETRDILSIAARRRSLVHIRPAVDGVRELVLNVRVGGNDFCSCYGLRRSVNNTIYDIGILNSVLSDIANVFAEEYVVSAPVWEYFENDPDDTRWLIGLKRELELDRLNGFIGKTCIHPSQIEAVNQSLQVSESDYLDAANILGWQNAESGVAKSADGSRMNELKCHKAWAVKTMALALTYGVVKPYTLSKVGNV